jgi:hypothetical protein
MEKTLSSYYPGINSKTYYALYAPAISRFLLIDQHNLFCFFRTAQVLSSKINTVVLILPSEENHPQMKNENCLRFALNHSKFQSEISGSNLKQSPTVIFLRNNKIIKTTFPIDFEKTERKEKLIELQTYAQFVNLCIHSIMLTSLINQQVHIEAEQEDYKTFYFNKNQKPGLVTEIMHILLFADSIQEAKEELKQFWIKKIQKNLEERVFWLEKIKIEFSTHCSMFYEIAKIEVPLEIQTILNNDRS